MYFFLFLSILYGVSTRDCSCICIYTFVILKKLSDVMRSPAQTGRIFGNVRNAVIIPIKLRFLHTFLDKRRVKNFVIFFYVADSQGSGCLCMLTSCG